ITPGLIQPQPPHGPTDPHLFALIQESIDQVVLNDDREQSFDEFGLGGVTSTGSPNDRIMDV
ncbi:MAG: hypothetical protein WA756_19530, partial [Pseudolabrys sp.]